MKRKLSRIGAATAVAVLAMTCTQTVAHAETTSMPQVTPAYAAAPSVSTFDREINYMNRRMENFFNSFPDENMWVNFPSQTDWRGSNAFPATDIIDNGKNFVVRMALPGRNPKGIHVSITKHYITIKGRNTAQETFKSKDYLLRENASGAFARTITLPQSADTAHAKATYKEGMLTITMPKKITEKAQTHDLPIESIN